MWQKTMLKAAKLTEQDTAFMFALYEYRCLDVRQAHQYFYPAVKGKTAFQVSILTPLVEMELIELVEYKAGTAVFLQREGVDIIRDEYELSTHIVDDETHAIKRGYYSAGELRMNPRLVTHQVGLNEFILQFQERVSQALNWKHYGEKFVSSYFGIRPDAMLRLLDVDIFLEQDMNTESEQQLFKKWNHYRTYLRSKEHEMNPRRIIVFFIIDNIKRDQTIKNRKELVRFTAVDSLIDCFDDDFDMVIGTREELLNYIFDWVIPTLKLSNPRHNTFIQTMQEKHGFIVRDAGKLSTFMEDEYDFVGYKTDKDNNLVVEHNRVQEFLIEDASFSPLSLMHKVDYHKRNSAAFRRSMNRGISSIFLVDDEEEIRKHLKLAGLLGTEQVFYTTLERLETAPFEEALFAFDSMGNRFHFADTGLVERVIEKENNA